MQAEIGYALGLNKPILPLVAQTVAENPKALGMLNGVEHVPFDLEAPQEGLLSLTDWVQKFAQSSKHKRTRRNPLSPTR